jgi:hypothetical protein
MAAMLHLSKFESELRRNTLSEHPAVAQSAQLALESLAQMNTAED